jgi:AraC-like DNA-binding protein
MSPRAGRLRSGASEPPWLRRLEDYYWLHDLLRVSVGVPAWGLRFVGQGGRVWRDLTQVLPPLAPFHFEMAFGRDGERDDYYARLAKQALATGRPAEGELFGFRDLMVPVGQHGREATVLYFGQYLAQAPDYDRLAQAWSAISGRPAALSDPDFDAFLSSALRLQVLPEPARLGLHELGGHFAAHLRGETRSRLEAALDALRKRAFRPWVPHPVWAYQAIGFDKHRPAPWHPGDELHPWMREELGLRHPPSTVLALLPLQQEPARGRVLARALLGEAWAWCRQRGGVTVAPFSEEGLVFLAETPAGKGAAAVRAGLGDLAAELRELGRRRGLDCAVGIGAPVPRGERLFSSYQQAVLSLQMAVQAGRRTLFYEPGSHAREAFSYASLARSARELTVLFEQGAAEALRPAADEHVRRVLEFAAGRLEAARGQFLASTFACLEALGRRQGPADEGLSALGRSLSQPMEEARGMIELLAAYEAGLRRLAHWMEGRQGRRLDLQGLVAWLGENFRRPLRLSSAARQAGLSVPAFTRAFRKATGQSFAAWLRRRRCDEALALLRGTPLPLAEVARQCGFSGVPSFLRAFKAQVGTTPGQWREKLRSKGL